MSPTERPSPLHLPQALLSLDDTHSLAAMEQAQERLDALRLQRALLMVASVFERFPSARSVGFEISEAGPGGALIELNALSNRSPRHLTHFFDGYVLKRVGSDPDAGLGPDDELIQTLLDQASALLLSLGQRQLHRAIFERSPNEPASVMALRRGLSPEAFAQWEAAFVEARAAPDPAPSRRPPSI